MGGNSIIKVSRISVQISTSRTNSPPQVNGQTKVTNRTLLKIIKAKLDEAKGAWSEELPNVLWDYKTMARTLTGETPFKLTNGTEAMIPVEVGMTSVR